MAGIRSEAVYRFSRVRIAFEVLSAVISVLMSTRSVAASEIPESVAVTVCMSHNSVAIGNVARAEEIAGRMFAKVGVTLNWRRAAYDCPAEAIIVSLTVNTPNALRPNTLAYSLPYEGTHIRVFFDRVHEVSRQRPSIECPLLAHVLVHEITHLLQGRTVHSNGGVMKSPWGQKEYDQMLSNDGLAFTPEDVSWIRSGLAARAAKASATVATTVDHGNSNGTSLFEMRP